MRFLLCVLCLALSFLPVIAAPAPLPIPVWPGLAPGETTANPGHAEPEQGDHVTRLTDVTEPQLFVFRPDDQPGHPAVLVFPGGGYSILAVDLEGTEIAHWLNGLGYVAAVLHYRVPNNRDGAYQDAQRAVSLVRLRAREFGVDAGRIGVLGFSAGGHLAARLSAGTATRAYSAVDAAENVSCRPDFTLLIYPAYLTDKPTGQIAPEVKPHAGMPPVFLTQTRQDPYFCILPYAAASSAAGVAAEVLAYEGGGHGYGLHASADQPVSHWPEEAAAWLRVQTASAGSGK